MQEFIYRMRACGYSETDAFCMYKSFMRERNEEEMNEFIESLEEEQAPAPTPEQSADLKQAPEPAPSFPDFNPDDFALKEDIEKLKREIEELKKEQRAHTPAPMRRAGKQEAKKNE